MLKPDAEGHVARYCWPKLTCGPHAPTGVRQGAERGERKCFVYNWVARG